MTDTVIESAGVAVITVNGEGRHVASGSTLGDLLRAVHLTPALVVVELNRTILRDRSVYDALELRGGDTIEIVHFVGGG